MHPKRQMYLVVILKDLTEPGEKPQSAHANTIRYDDWRERHDTHVYRDLTQLGPPCRDPPGSTSLPVGTHLAVHPPCRDPPGSTSLKSLRFKEMEDWCDAQGEAKSIHVSFRLSTAAELLSCNHLEGVTELFLSSGHLALLSCSPNTQGTLDLL